MENKKDPFEKNKIKKCDVCSNKVPVDQFGQGQCQQCGWEQCELGMHSVHKVIYPNLVPFSKAITYFKAGKKIKPDFEDFLGMLSYYLHNEFSFNNKKYGVLLGHNEPKTAVEFYEWNVEDGYQLYQTIEEFADKAHINGVLLKDLWDDVIDANYMSG